jgi:hypothetical protein
MGSFPEGRVSGTGLPPGARRSAAGPAVLAALFPILLLIGGCATLPSPAPEDLVRLDLGSQVRLEDLQVGRKHYISSCSSCHSLHLPSQFTPKEWEKIMVEMQPKAKIGDARRDSIMTYLSAYAAEGDLPRNR